jgi:hypothetical protein
VSEKKKPEVEKNVVESESQVMEVTDEEAR